MAQNATVENECRTELLVILAMAWDETRRSRAAAVEPPLVPRYVCGALQQVVARVAWLSPGGALALLESLATVAGDREKHALVAEVVRRQQSRRQDAGDTR